VQLIAILVVGCMLAGCSRGESPSGLQTSDAAGFPVVLSDAQGVAVRIERRPERIVSTAPTATEILFALGAGDRVVAVTDQCGYPPEVRDLPRIGGWFTPSLEKTLAAEPDLVVASRGNPADFLEALRKSGRPVFSVDPQTLEDIFTAIGDIGRAAGVKAAADDLTAEMRGRLDAVAGRLADVPEQARPTAFMFLQIAPLWTAGSRTFQDDAMRAAGARNIAATEVGFVPYSMETLLAADPDFLLLSTMEGDPERMKREVLSKSAFRRLSAAREGRLVVLEADPIMRPGPRIVGAVEAMARTFYPQRFSESASPSSAATSDR